MSNWGSVALENIAEELKSIREILEKQYTTEQSSKVDIVHCEDCKYYTPLEESRPFYCSIGIWRVNANDFCSYGERKEE